MKVYVEHVSSNIKKGCDHKLGPKTLIVGANGKGKTTIINALELALCSQVTDLLGKEIVKRPADLIQLTHDKRIWSACKLSDGRTVEVESKRTKTGASRLKKQGSLNAVMPYLEVKGHLTGSPQVARSYLMDSQIGNAVTHEEVRDRLSEEHQGRYEKSSRRYKSTGRNPLTVLKQVIEDSKVALRTLQEEKRTLTRAIDHLGSGMNPEPTQKKVDAAKKDLEDAQRALHEAPRGKTKEQIDQLRERCKQEIQQLQLLEEKLKDIPVGSFTDQDLKIVEVRTQLLETLEMHQDLESSNCLICGTERAVSYFEDRKLRLLAQTGKLIELYKNSQEASKVQTDIVVKRTKIEDLIRELKDAEANQTTVSFDALQSAINIAQEKYMSLRSTQSNWKRLRSDRHTLHEVENQIKEMSAYNKILTELSTQLLDNAKSNFVEAVQKYLPETFNFGLNILENRCEIGFQNGKGLNTALSGAEWVSMILALSAAFSTKGKDLSVITPEERAYDPVTLAAIMKSLQKSESQVILTSTVMPSEVPDGWTVVEI